MCALSIDKLSVIVPALNEAGNICQALTRIFKALEYFKIDGEVIVINDGSFDQTQVLVEEKSAEYPGRIRIIKHSATKGIGASFWEGVDLAQGAAIVFLPGDNENDPQEALRYYKLLEHVDIIVPFIFNRRERPLFRNMLSLLYRFIINTTFSVNFNYTNGTVLYRKSVLQQINHRADGFFFQTDILIRLVKKGYLFAEVPHKIGTRKKGVSKAISFPSLFQVVAGYFKLVQDYYHRQMNQDLNYSSDSQTAARSK